MAICANKTRPQERAHDEMMMMTKEKEMPAESSRPYSFEVFFFSGSSDRSSDNSIATMFCVLVSEILFPDVHFNAD